MKRRKPLKRGRSAQQSKKRIKRTPLAPSTKPLKRTKLTRSVSAILKPPKSFAQPHARFKANILAAGMCRICGRGPKAILKSQRVPVILDPHHVIPQRYIRRHVSAMRLRDGEAEIALLAKLLFDERNGMCVCRDCHDAHETAGRRITRAEIPESAVEFAIELEMLHVIERFYPDET